MMTTKIAFGMLCLVLTTVDSRANSCSTVNYCQIQRRSWVESIGWKTSETQELKFDKLCLADMAKHEVLVEPTLALGISVAPGDPKSSVEVLKNPGVLLHLYTPLTHAVVGNSISPLDAKTIDIHKRLGTGGMVEVKCMTK